MVFDIKKLKTKSPIFTIDIYAKKSYLFDRLFQADKYNKNCFSISYMRIQDLNNSILSLENIPDLEIEESIEIRAIEELGLPLEDDHKIIYKEVENVDKNDRYFNLFITTHNNIQKLYDRYIKKYKYIDLILPFGLLYESLYDLNILESAFIDCFIYFQKDDANISIYKNGCFIFSKHVEQNLLLIYENFIKFSENEVEYKQFCNMLCTNSYKSDKSFEFAYMQSFEEVFLLLKDSFEYIKRSFGFKNIDRIFISSDYGTINYMQDYISAYLDIKSSGFTFNDLFEQKEVDDLSKLMTLSAISYQNDKSKTANLSLFKRPKPFFDTKNGELVLVCLGSVAILAFYPAYLYISNFQEIQKQDTLIQKLSKLEKETKELKVKIKSLQNSIEIKNDAISKVKANYDKKFELLKQLHKSKVKNRSISKHILRVFELVNQSGTKIVNLSIEKNILVLLVTSRDEKSIIKFLLLLSKDNYFSIKTEQITKNEDSDEFETLVEISVDG